MTGSSFATAIIYAGPIVGILIAVAIAALFVCNWLESRAACAEAAYLARRDAAREAACAASLAHWRSVTGANPELATAAEQAWEDHPAHRADIAKTRTAANRARMTREAWLNSPVTVTANDFDLWSDEKGSAS